MKNDLYSRVKKMLDDLASDWEKVAAQGIFSSRDIETLEEQLKTSIIECEQFHDITDTVVTVGHSLSKIPAIKSFIMAKTMADIHKEQENGTFGEAASSEYGLVSRITSPEERSLFLEKLKKLYKTVCESKIERSSFSSVLDMLDRLK